MAQSDHIIRMDVTARDSNRWVSAGRSMASGHWTVGRVCITRGGSARREEDGFGVRETGEQAVGSVMILLGRQSDNRLVSSLDRKMT